MEAVDESKLPYEVRVRLSELELELSEGDITEKGYQKKKQKILAGYLDNRGIVPSTSTPTSSAHIPSGAILLPGLTENGARQLNRRGLSTNSDGDDSSHRSDQKESQQNVVNRRYLSSNNHYRSSIRDEAVKEALVQHQPTREGFHLNKRRETSRISSVKQMQDAAANSDDDVSSESSLHGRRLSNLNQSHTGTDTTHYSAGSSGSQNAPKFSSKLPNHSAVVDRIQRSHPKKAVFERYDKVPSLGDLVSAAGVIRPPTRTNQSDVCNPQLHQSKRESAVVVGQHQNWSSSELGSLQTVDSFEQLAALNEAQLSLDDSSADAVVNRSQLVNFGQQTQLPFSPQSIVSNSAVAAPILQPSSNGCVTGSGMNSQQQQRHNEEEEEGIRNRAHPPHLDEHLIMQRTGQTTDADRKLSRPSDTSPQTTGLICQNRVSEKIQQLVNTLKRPKRHPLPEYFLDDEEQILVTPVSDPSAPRPRGPPSQLLIGEELGVLSGSPRNLESAVQRYASLSCKTPVMTCLDLSGRPNLVITYTKLLQRSSRIAYAMLHKTGHRGEQLVKPGDRVALVYPNNEPISYLCAFYGCIFASVVPVTIEVPSSRRDSSCQSMGFLLSSLDVHVVLTSEQCYKALPRGPNGEITTYIGWPRVMWMNTDHHASSGTKLPKDWSPPDRLGNDSTMYIEYTYTKDGSVYGVMVSRRSALAHCRALTLACNYTEEDVVVCVVDTHRGTGLWHAILTSVFNGLQVIVVPYSVMQIDPGSWLRMVTKYRASVAIVKSRDMHWALLAQGDHPNINLSSLRMLFVADGSNPWSLNSCDSFVQKFSSRGFAPEAICPSAGSSETLTLCLRRPVQNSSHYIGANGKVYANGNQTNPVPTLSSVRGVISIHSLTYGVVHVDTEDSLTSLVLQDCGQVLPGASAVIVQLGSQPILCQTDEVGEICLSSDQTGCGYFGLQGQTDAYFHVKPLNADGSLVYQDKSFIRSGYLGFHGPVSSGGLIFICGSVQGMMNIANRRHNADDIIATVLAVQPMKIVYRGRIAVFSVSLLKDERLVIVAELRQGFSDEAAFTWMSLVLQAVDTIHQVNVYCLALCKQNTLPKTPFGGINCYLVKRLLTEGQLHPTALLLCPHSAIQNLPQPRQLIPSQVGPSAIMVGQVVQGVRMAEARGRPLQPISANTAPGFPDSSSGPLLLIEILNWRSLHTPDDRLFTVFNVKGQECSTLTCSQLMHRAERLAVQLQEKGKARSGTVVALLYAPGTEMICAFYACLLIGAIPVLIRPPRTEHSTTSSANTANASNSSIFSLLTGPHGSGSSTALFNVNGSPGGSANSSTTGSDHHASSGSYPNVYFSLHTPNLNSSMELMWNVVKYSNAAILLTQTSIYKFLKSKEATSRVPFKNWPTILDTEENTKRKSTILNKITPGEQPVAYLDFSASTTGTLTGIKVTHTLIHSLCLAQKVQCEFYPTREVVLTLDPYCGLGFTLWALISIYCGHHSILIPPNVTETAPELWLSVCSQRKVRDAFCSSYTMELTTRHLAKQMPYLKSRDICLSHLRSLVVVAEERPRLQLISTFTKLSNGLGLQSRAVTTSFGCRANLAISLQGASSPESTTVYVDRFSLRNDRVKLLEKGSPHSLCLMESGKLLPGVHVAIANSDTFGQCADSQLGEIWVSSPHNSTELLGPFDSGSLNSSEIVRPTYNNTTTNDCLNARLVTGDTERVYARTGYLGFVRRTELTQLDGELHDAIFVVGSLEEAILLRGMRYHPVDIETTIMRAHRKICECAVFTWSNLLVAVAELASEEHEAIDLVHPITAHVLAEHQMIVGVVVVVDPGTVPVNSCGEKQRILLRDSFVNDKLDPIYVSYNM